MAYITDGEARVHRFGEGLFIAVLLLGSGLAQTGSTNDRPVAQAQTPTAAPTAAQTIAKMQAQLRDWGGLNRYHAENAALPPPAAGEKRVVFFGDSITDSWGRGPENGTFFPGKPYVNRGISGQTTPQMLVRFEQDVVRLRPAAVVILAGTNDVAGNTGPETPEMIEDNFRAMTALAKSNGIRVVLSSILPVFDYPWRPGLEPAGKIRDLNAWLRSFAADEHVVYLDYAVKLADERGGMRPGTSKDGVHPNAAGYAVMSPLAAEAIERALGPGGR